MINCIYFDLDSCLIYCSFQGEDGFSPSNAFYLKKGGAYSVCVRKGAKESINFARALIGINNVYILTTASREYALAVNKMAGFGFEEDHIFAREDTKPYPLGYGHGYVIHGRASKDNVLIDDLPFEGHDIKINFTGISKDGFLQVRAFYGDYEGEYNFEDRVCKFLEKRME